MATIVRFPREKVSVCSMGSKLHEDQRQLYLPLFPENFRGMVWIIHFEAITAELLDNLYRRYYLSAVVDFRSFPLLGKSERAHRKICEYIDKMKVRYIRLNDLVSHFEDKAVFCFNRRSLFLKYLKQQSAALEPIKSSIDAGSVAFVTSNEQKKEDYLKFIYEGCGATIKEQTHCLSIE